MNHQRLHSLTDGIFAIVMTLMVLELKLPSVTDGGNNHDLWTALMRQKVIFISYFVSFSLLFIYWRAHNFIITFLAKNIDINLLSINAIFLFLVGLIPFSTQLAGTYNGVPLAIILYSLNIIVIGLSLLGMRLYIERSDAIENVTRTAAQRRAALIRGLLPVTFAVIAIPCSFASTSLAYGVLVAGVGFNFFNNAADLTDKYLLQPVRNLFS